MIKLGYLSLFLFAFYSCGPKKVLLELNLEKGKTYYQNVEHVSNVFQHINEKPQRLIVEMTASLSYKVIEIIDSIYNVQVEYERMAMNIDSENEKQTYSSEFDNKSDLVSCLLGMMVRQPFRIKMTKNGKILQIADLDNILMKAYNQLPEMPKEQKTLMIKQIEDAYGGQKLKENFEMATAIFSGKQVSKGDKWKAHYQIAGAMKLNHDTEFEFIGSEKKYHYIMGSTDLRTIDESFNQVGAFKIKYSLEGKMKSMIKIDQNSGWTLESRINQVMGGTAWIQKGGIFEEDFAIPMEIRSTTVTKDEKSPIHITNAQDN